MIYCGFFLYFVYQQNILSINLPVIVLDDVTHSPDSRQVFIKALRVDIMEGHRGLGIAVGAGKINSNLAQECREYEIRYYFNNTTMFSEHIKSTIYTVKENQKM